MKAGLLGALKGFGEGIEGVGLSIQKRREQALEDARELAKEQARQAQRSAERAEDRELRVSLHEDTQANQRDIAERQITSRREDIGTRQAGQEKLVGMRGAQAKDLARYRSALSASNTKAAADYKHQLSQGDVKGIQPGRIRESDGFVEVIGVRKDGKAFPTGQWVVPNFFKTPTQTFGKPGGAADEPSLIPDEEEEEEE